MAFKGISWQQGGHITPDIACYSFPVINQGKAYLLLPSSPLSPFLPVSLFPLPLSEGLILPCKQEGRREQRCAQYEWTPVTSSPFSSVQLQDQGHLAVGREGGRKRNGTAHFRILPTLKAVTHILFSSCSLRWHGTLWSGRNQEVKTRAKPKPQPLTGKE